MRAADMNLPTAKKSCGAAHAFNRRLRLAPALALSLLAVSFPLCAAGPGSASLQALKSDISPRAMGMGGSFVAVADDIYSTNYNPAGLAQLYMPEFSAMYLSGFEDAKLEYLAVGLPMPFLGLAGLEKPVMAVSVLFSDAGRFTWRTIDTTDGSVSARGLNGQMDRVLTLSYGEKVYSGDVNIEGYKAKIEQYFGMSAKYITSEMLEKYSASALAFDAGWLAMEPNLGLTAGLGLANYGGGIRYVSRTEKLPSILRLGLSWQRPTVMDQSALLSVEEDFYTAEDKHSLRFGLEYHFEKIFNVRAGYKTLEDNSGLTLGLGIHYQDIVVDFAMSPGSEVFNTSQVAFSYKFSGFVSSAYKRKVNFKEHKPEQKSGNREPDKKAKSAPGGEKSKKDPDFFWIE